MTTGAYRLHGHVREATLPHVILDESALAKVGALAQSGQHSAFPVSGLRDDDGTLLDDGESGSALALPEDVLARPELHRLKCARYQLPVVLQRPLQPFARPQSSLGSEHMRMVSLEACNSPVQLIALPLLLLPSSTCSPTPV